MMREREIGEERRRTARRRKTAVRECGGRKILCSFWKLVKLFRVTAVEVRGGGAPTGKRKVDKEVKETEDATRERERGRGMEMD